MQIRVLLSAYVPEGQLRTHSNVSLRANQPGEQVETHILRFVSLNEVTLSVQFRAQILVVFWPNSPEGQ